MNLLPITLRQDELQAGSPSIRLRTGGERGVRRRFLSLIAYRLSLLGCVLFILILSYRFSHIQAALTPLPDDVCPGSTALFPPSPQDDERTTDTVERWKNAYHRNVGTIIDEHLRKEAEQLQCTEEPHRVPGDTLRLIAKELPGWKDDLSGLREEDMPSILLDYLDTYECTLQNRGFFLGPSALSDLQKGIGPASPGPSGIPGDVLILPFVSTASRQKETIDRELILARATLDRTLKYLAGSDRLTPLRTGLDCFARSLLDIRNSLGLAADASSCMSKAQDAMGTLRGTAPSFKQ